MADSNPLNDLITQDAASPQPSPAMANPLNQMIDQDSRGELQIAPRTGVLEAAGVHAATGIVPAAGVIGGAELGAEAGAVVGGPVGAVVGGLAGGWFGGYAGSKAQDTALQAMPDRWRDPLENEQAISETEHPYASMLGGFAPYIATMSPLNAARGALPENATAWQKIATNPWVARAFGGVLQGGAELTQEYANHETPDWAKVGIATGFGFVFNRPNRIGEAITRSIRAPFESLLHPEEPAPTIANADANNVAGPGVTEAVATGELKRNEATEQAAQEAARIETSIIAPPKPDVNEIVGRLRPDLVARRDELEGHIGGFQSLIREAHERAALEGESIPDLASERQHISALNEELRGVQTELASVYRHAAEATGSETAPRPESSAEMRAAEAEIAPAKPAAEAAAPGEAPAAPTAAAHLAGVPAVAAEGEAVRPLGEQKRFIADDVAQRMIAAGWDADIAKENGVRLANYWSVHASRLNGAGGTAEQLYLKERTEYAPPPARGKVGIPALAAMPLADPLAVWNRLVAKRAQRTRAVETGQNLETTRIGGKAHKARTQSWRPGDIVDAGIVKNLFVAGTPAEGEYTLLAKPNEQGQSVAYSFKPHGGIVRLDEKQDFLRAAESLGKPPTETDASAKAERLGYTNLIRAMTKQGASPRDISGVVGGKMTAKEIEQVAREHELAQRPGEEKTRGTARIRSGKQTIITRFKNADASTIVHEEAHDWLARMMRDSFHEQASGELKDDAQSVADWLKINRGEGISRKAHEKFARAWERYTWEGVAPSHALARIFEKFTGWLRAIYNSVRDIPGAPEIPPEIRAVFDRMLTDRNENIVIADHVEGRPTLGDIHAADIAETPPGPAAEAASDRIVAEATRKEQEHEPARKIIESAATEAAERPGETTERPNEAGLLAEGGGGPEPNAERRGGGGGPGEELGRGGAGVSEGAPAGTGAEPRSVARQPARPAGGGAIPHPEPRDEFGPDTRDVDKAGNINLDRIAAPEDVKRVIRAAAEANNDFIGDRRGVVTWGETVQLAEALGMNASGLLQRKIGQAFNASEAWAARRLLVQSAHATHDAMRAAADGDEAALLAYVHARERHKLIQAQVAGLTAEAGRALNIFRKVAGGEGGDVAQAVDKIIRDGAGITLDQARKEAKLGAALETPEQVSEFMNATRKPGFGDMLLEYWINGLISGPATHITYSVANELLSLTRAAPETAVAAMIGRIRASMGRTGTRVLAGEVARRLETMVGTGARAGAQAAVESFKAGSTLRLPGEKGVIGQPLSGGAGAPLATAPTLEPGTFGAVRGLKEGFVTGAAVLKATGDEGAPRWGAAYSRLGAIPEVQTPAGQIPTGTVARLPSRAIAGIHSFFRVSNYLMEINALAYRQAMEEHEGMRQAGGGFNDTQLAARIEELKRNPTPEMMEAARATATNATLMGPAGLFTQKLQQLINTPIDLPGVGPIRLLRFIDPFVQISSNIIKEGLLARTPVGLLSKTLRDDLMGKNGNIAADMAASRMLCGTALAATAVTLAAQGYINGSGPGDRKLAAVWREAGNLPHSVRIGDMWYAMNRLGPLGLLMGVSADLYDVAHNAEERNWMRAGAILQEAFTHNILDESFLRGPSDLIKAIGNPASDGERWLANMGTSFLPFSVGMAQLARGADPFSRQARSFMDQVKAKTPGLSETLLPRISIWGAPMPAYDAVIHSGVTAIYEQRQNTDPVDLTLLKLGIGVGMPGRTIRGVQLTDQQWTDYAMLSGRMLKGRLDRLVVSRDFQHSPANTQADLIRAAVDANREVARGWMLARYPQILQAGYRNKIQIQRRGTN